jgi:hypothetical protein
MNVDTTTPAMWAISNSTTGSSMTTGTHSGTFASTRKSKNSVVFKGTIEIMQVANGFVMNVATKEGYEYDTYVASTIQEVNERLAATIVSFKLEQP